MAQTSRRFLSGCLRPAGERARFSQGVGTPSPVPRRLEKVPSRAILSPKGERAWSFYNSYGYHARLCRPVLRKGFAFPGTRYRMIVFSARLRLAG